MQPSRRWRKKAELYRLFAVGWDNLDFSETAAKAMFDYESTGRGNLALGIFSSSKVNGFAVGKYYRDWQVTEWRKAITDGMLSKEELYTSNKYPKEWLDRVLANCEMSLFTMLDWLRLYDREKSTELEKFLLAFYILDSIEKNKSSSP